MPILVCVQTKLCVPSVPLPFLQSHGSHGAIEALHKPHDEGRVGHDEGLATLSRFDVYHLFLILEAWNPKTLNITANKYKSDNIFQQYNMYIYIHMCVYVYIYIYIYDIVV